MPGYAGQVRRNCRLRRQFRNFSWEEFLGSAGLCRAGAAGALAVGASHCSKVPTRRNSPSTACHLHSLRVRSNPPNIHSPRLPCYMCYMCYMALTRQATEHPLSPGFLAICAICAIWLLQGKPLNIHSPPGPCYMCYMCYMALTRQATEHPLSPGSMLYVLYVLYGPI